jgi:hypothetical protein
LAPATVVRCAVDLDGQLRLQAREIQHKRPRRMLPPKLEAAGSLPKLLPEQHLG